MKLILKVLIKIAAVIGLSYLLSKFGLQVTVNEPLDAVKVAIVLSLLNTFLKPIISFFSLPISCLTLGLFTLVISAAMVKLADSLLAGFSIGGVANGWLTALIFSLGFTFICSTVEKFIVDDK
ncbi:MAG: phage holin family protein [Chitinophagales bacterium]|nr:phage holin family protein [Chitinophagales bacterium]